MARILIPFSGGFDSTLCIVKAIVNHNDVVVCHSQIKKEATPKRAVKKSKKK